MLRSRQQMTEDRGQKTLRQAQGRQSPSPSGLRRRLWRGERVYSNTFKNFVAKAEGGPARRYVKVYRKKRTE
jgi:hypothetical protein